MQIWCRHQQEIGGWFSLECDTPPTKNPTQEGRPIWVRVDWEGKYPVVNPGYSQVQYRYPLPPGVNIHLSNERFTDDFDRKSLDPLVDISPV